MSFWRSNQALLRVIELGAGLVYSVEQSMRYAAISGYDPLTVDYEDGEWITTYLPRVSTTLGCTPVGDMEPDAYWQAGYYFGNGLFRVCAMAEKLSRVAYRDSKRVFQECSVLATIQDVRNRFVHQQTHYRRVVGFSELVSGLTYLITTLEEVSAEKMRDWSAFPPRRRASNRSTGGSAA